MIYTYKMSIKCPICEITIPLQPDGVLRYCQCRILGVDHTPHYTRCLGINPDYPYDPQLIKDIKQKLNIKIVL